MNNHDSPLGDIPDDDREDGAHLVLPTWVGWLAMTVLMGLGWLLVWLFEG